MAPNIAIGVDKQQSHLYSTNIDYALQQLQLTELQASSSSACAAIHANGQKISTNKRKALTQLTGNAQENGGERIVLFKLTMIFVNIYLFNLLFNMSILADRSSGY